MTAVCQQERKNLYYLSNFLLLVITVGRGELPVVHTEAALPHGLRVTIGSKTLSYSGDTEWTENLITLANHADLFICECNFYNSRVKGHLDYFTLRDKLSLLTYKKIMLTHFDSEMLNNLESVALDYAEDGKVLFI